MGKILGPIARGGAGQSSERIRRCEYLLSVMHGMNASRLKLTAAALRPAGLALKRLRLNLYILEEWAK